MTSPALELTGIDKRFGALVALENVSLVVRPGTVHALLGENGAGKTTLMHIACGMLRPDAGGARIRGRPVQLATPLDAIGHGIGMVHQHFTLVPTMTVAENLALGGQGLLRAKDMRARVQRAADRTGFALEADAVVETLPVGAQQRVEISKALARDASILILDEPTAVLAPSEIDDLLSWLRTYVRDGNAAVLITHKLREAFAVADDLTVLRRGRVVLTTPVEATTVAAVSSAMIGTAVEELGTLVVHPPGDVVFRATHMQVAGSGGRSGVRDASFTIAARELVAVAGVEGAGQRELLRALAGRLPITRGELARPDSVGFVPEDRHIDAVLLDRSLAENVALRDAGSRRGVMGWAEIANRTRELIEAFDVRATAPFIPMRALSGGNQQKLVVGREMDTATGPLRALVVENPTRGLDVRASADFHRRLRQACDEGAAVVVYSSDVDEILALATRVLVLYDGRVREVARDRTEIGRAMLGVS